MKAFILCGGQGTRIREHTDTRPKPMIEIGGRPILWHIMKTYAHHGITDFVLCLGYKGDMIRDYFLNYEFRNRDITVTLGRGVQAPGALAKGPDVRVHGAPHEESGWSVTLADTGENALTGARIARAAARHLGPDDKTFCITYGDGVTDADISGTIRFHESHGGLATVTGVRPPYRFGEIRTDADGRAHRFAEKPQVSEGMINGGYLVVDRGFLRYLGEHESCSLESDALESCGGDGNLYVYEHDGYWQCMDTYRDWMQLEERWKSGDTPWKVWA